MAEPAVSPFFTEIPAPPEKPALRSLPMPSPGWLQRALSESGEVPALSDLELSELHRTPAGQFEIAAVTAMLLHCAGVVADDETLLAEARETQAKHKLNAATPTNLPDTAKLRRSGAEYQELLSEVYAASRGFQAKFIDSGASNMDIYEAVIEGTNYITHPSLVLLEQLRAIPGPKTNSAEKLLRFMLGNAIEQPGQQQ